jgi:2-polyprenyl-3-methyl-5-hydroxy-6-metoxy-1,4-benzoquinol methylase
VLVIDYMSLDIEQHSCDVDAIIRDVLKIMTKTGCVFVVNDDKKLIGIITDGDLRRLLDSPEFNQYGTVKEILIPNPKCISVNSELIDAKRMMDEESINTLPVINEEKKLIGFIDLHSLSEIFSPERIYPLIDEETMSLAEIENTRNENEVKHLARYKFAKGFINRSDRVLDCACGSGYGSKLLIDRASKVIGVDISNDAISYAKEHYKDENIEFYEKSIDDLAFDDNYFDVGISVETIEHVTSEVALSFLKKLAFWVKPGGVVVISSPMLRYIDGKPYVTNPYHINEMPRSEFLELCRVAMPDYKFHFYYQNDHSFLPLLGENTGFCISVGRRSMK